MSLPSPRPLTAYSVHRGREITVCQRHEHDFAEGDEGAICCVRCCGYVCGTCEGRGALRDINGETKGCYACSRIGVVMWWKPEGRCVNPYNWAVAAREDPANA